MEYFGQLLYDDTETGKDDDEHSADGLDSSNPDRSVASDSRSRRGGGGDDYDDDDIDVQAWTSGVANSLASLWSEYSRDITEFATGVQSETSNLVQTAVDAAPEVASTAQDKFGMIKASFVKGSTEFLTQVQESVAFDDKPATTATGSGRKARGKTAAADGQKKKKKYNRYEAELSALQRDSNTYCKPPSDTCAFKIWTDNFDMRSKAEEISALLSGNPFMQELYSRIVPYVVDKNVFWTRYFFHVSKLHEAQQLRMHLLQKAIRSTEAEELDTWEDEEGATGSGRGGSGKREDKREVRLDHHGDDNGDGDENATTGGASTSLPIKSDHRDDGHANVAEIGDNDNNGDGDDDDAATESIDLDSPNTPLSETVAPSESTESWAEIDAPAAAGPASSTHQTQLQGRGKGREQGQQQQPSHQVSYHQGGEEHRRTRREDDCNESGMSVSSSEWTKVDRDAVAAAAAQMPVIEPDPEDWGSWE